MPGVTIRQYGRLVARGSIGTEREDELAERVPSFWSREIPDPPEDFFRFENTDFKLTTDEAEWLCERVASVEAWQGRPNLLDGFVRDLRRGRPSPTVNHVWDAHLPWGTAEGLRDLVYHGRCFSYAIQGAALLYNLMLAEALLNLKRTDDPSQAEEPNETTSPDFYRSSLNAWARSLAPRELADWAADIRRFWDCLQEAGAKVSVPTRLFVDAWAECLVLHGPESIADSPEARTVIMNRELGHKKSQARLANRKRLLEYRGQAGTALLSYRWPLIKRLLRDTAAGLAAPVVDDAVA